MLYPYKTVPILKKNLWGGQNLKRLGKIVSEETLGESWELSTLQGNESLIANGPEQGHSIKKLIEKHPSYLLGEDFYKKYKNNVPFLLKYIDANDKLSIQVHPDDNYAFHYENGQLGKTEMWYVIDAKPHASIFHGLKENRSTNDLNKVINKQETIENVLRKIFVEKGDIIYIPAGTVHAINGGIVVAEIQQHSDLTYRIYDYDRIDTNGNKRPLHLNKAMAVISHQNKKPKFNGLKIENKNYQIKYLAITKNFCVKELKMNDGIIKFKTDNSFHAFMILEGEACFVFKNIKTIGRALETVLIPAGLNSCNISGNFTALDIFTANQTQNQMMLKDLLDTGYSISQIYKEVAGIDELELFNRLIAFQEKNSFYMKNAN